MESPSPMKERKRGKIPSPFRMTPLPSLLGSLFPNSPNRKRIRMNSLDSPIDLSTPTPDIHISPMKSPSPLFRMSMSMSPDKSPSKRKGKIPKSPGKSIKILSPSQFETLMQQKNKFESVLLHKEYDLLNNCPRIRKLRFGRILGEGKEGTVYNADDYVIKLSDMNNDLEKNSIESFIALILASDVQQGKTINFPMTHEIFTCNNKIYVLMEKLVGLDEVRLTGKLFDNILFQILATIYYYQENYKMSHQDLHFGNIMLKPIDKSYKSLNYKINNKWYEVDNLGYAVVIIDFGFATYDYKRNHYARSFEGYKYKHNLKRHYRPMYDILYLIYNLFYYTYIEKKYPDTPFVSSFMNIILKREINIFMEGMPPSKSLENKQNIIMTLYYDTGRPKFVENRTENMKYLFTVLEEKGLIKSKGYWPKKYMGKNFVLN